MRRLGGEGQYGGSKPYIAPTTPISGRGGGGTPTTTTPTPSGTTYVYKGQTYYSEADVKNAIASNILASEGIQKILKQQGGSTSTIYLYKGGTYASESEVKEQIAKDTTQTTTTQFPTAAAPPATPTRPTIKEPSYDYSQFTQSKRLQLDIAKAWRLQTELKEKEKGLGQYTTAVGGQVYVKRGRESAYEKAYKEYERSYAKTRTATEKIQKRASYIQQGEVGKPQTFWQKAVGTYYKAESWAKTHITSKVFPSDKAINEWLKSETIGQVGIFKEQGLIGPLVPKTTLHKAQRAEAEFYRDYIKEFKEKPIKEAALFAASYGIGKGLSVGQKVIAAKAGFGAAEKFTKVARGVGIGMGGLYAGQVGAELMRSPDKPKVLARTAAELTAIGLGSASAVKTAKPPTAEITQIKTVGKKQPRMGEPYRKVDFITETKARISPKGKPIITELVGYQKNYRIKDIVGAGWEGKQLFLDVKVKGGMKTLMIPEELAPPFIRAIQNKPYFFGEMEYAGQIRGYPKYGVTGESKSLTYPIKTTIIQKNELATLQTDMDLFKTAQTGTFKTIQTGKMPKQLSTGKIGAEFIGKETVKVKTPTYKISVVKDLGFGLTKTKAKGITQQLIGAKTMTMIPKYELLRGISVTPAGITPAKTFALKTKTIQALPPPVSTQLATKTTQALISAALKPQMIPMILPRLGTKITQKPAATQKIMTPQKMRIAEMQMPTQKVITQPKMREIGKELMKELQKPISRSLQLEIQKPLQKELMIPMEKAMQKEQQKQLQKQMLKQLQKQKPMGVRAVSPFPFEPPITPPIIPSFKLDFKMGKGMSQLFGRGYKYSPSLGGLISGRTISKAPKPSKIFSGLELRPPVKTKKRWMRWQF